MTEPTEPIYADHAATTPLDPEAFAAMRPWLTDQYANPAALYRSGLAARRAVEQARRTVAACLGCAPHQIFFTSGGSEGNTWAILNGAGRPGPGSRQVVTTGIEHHSVSGACAFLQKQGVTVCTEPVAQIVGLARALELTCARRAESAAAKRALAADFCRTLRAGWPQARFHSGAAGLPGLVSVGLPGFDGQALTYRLDLAGVCVSPGAACDNTGRSHPSHVLLALGGTAAEDALCTLRFSFGAANRPGHGAEAARRLLQALQNPTIQPH